MDENEISPFKKDIATSGLFANGRRQPGVSLRSLLPDEGSYSCPERCSEKKDQNARNALARGQYAV